MQGSPVAGGNEGCPVVGVAGVGVGEHGELGGSEGGVASGGLGGVEQALVVADHEVFGLFVGYFPEADHLALGTGDDEGAT